VHYSLAIILVLLTSCQPALKPFSHLGNPPSKLVKLTDAKGIMVIPIIDSQGKRLDLLTKNMVAALKKQNTPVAYYAGNKSSFILNGSFIKSSKTNNLVWTLWTSEGDKIGTVIQPAIRSTDSANNFTELSSVEHSARAVVAFIQKDRIANISLPAIHVASVSGSTKKANFRLHQAIELAFSKIGMNLVSKPAVNSLVLQGFIEIDLLPNNKQYIKITSLITDSSGAQIAIITQSHKIMKKNFENKWNLISDEAALACAASTQELLRQIDSSQHLSNK